MRLRLWVLASSILWVCATAQAELVVNGSFEDGAFAPPSNATMTLVPGATALEGWEVFNDKVAWISAGNPFGISAADGARFLDLTDYQAGPPFGAIRQAIATVPGYEYLLSFKLGSATNQGRPCAVTVSAGATSETFTSPLTGTNNDWTPYSMTFTATEPQTTISIVGVTGVHYIGVDAVSVTPLEGGVVVAGKEWRQLTDTLRVTWNEVAAVCPQDGTTPCNGSVLRGSDGTSVDVTGWRWARNVDVQALFEAIIQPGTLNFTDEFDTYSTIDDPDIQAALGGGPAWFDPTRADAAGRYLFGLTATSGTEVGYRPWVRDAIAGNSDWVNLGTTLPKGSRQTYTGIWLFRPVGNGNELQSLALKVSEVSGCKSVTGTVTLPAPAPTGGVVVTLSDTLAAASTPVSLKVPEGVTAKTFTVTTVPVSATQSGQVSATLGSTTLSQDLAVKPMGLLSLTLTPVTVVGSQPVAGLAKLECKAGPGPVTVDLGSNAPAVAHPVAASVVVPQGLQSEAFTVVTNPVLVKSYATITGTANGVTKSKKLTVNTAAAVSPTSLKFGTVPVGSTSGVLNATLTNKGAVAFAVSSIGVTGTYASWFAQANNCPANLAAGASCTIGVTFKPLAVATRSAKLSIVTGAASAPLSVALSGTGL